MKPSSETLQAIAVEGKKAHLLLLPNFELPSARAVKGEKIPVLVDIVQPTQIGGQLTL
jgi:hypothetical protein